jgi:hypothetical protein
VAKKNLPAFKSIATEAGATNAVLYGRVERDVEAKFPFRSPAGPDGKHQFVRQRDYHLVNKIFPSSGS